MLDLSRFASIWRLAFLLAFLRGATPAPPSPRPPALALEVDRGPSSPAELGPLALPLAPRRRSRSGMRAPSTRGRTWRPRLRPESARRILAAGRRSKPQGSKPQGAPPPAPPAPPTESAPPASSPQVDRASALAIMRHYPAILGWMHRFGVPSRDAPDVAQQVVIAALPRWPAIVPWPGVLEGVAQRRWLAGVAWNIARAYRDAAARREQPTDPDTMPDRTTDETPETAIVAREDAAEMGLETLRASTTAARWTVFFAHEVEGLPLATIATIEGAPVSTIGTRLRLARRDLRAAVKRGRAQRAHTEKRTIQRAK